MCQLDIHSMRLVHWSNKHAANYKNNARTSMKKWPSLENRNIYTWFILSTDSKLKLDWFNFVFKCRFVYVSKYLWHPPQIRLISNVHKFNATLLLKFLWYCVEFRSTGCVKRESHQFYSALIDTHKIIKSSSLSCMKDM